MTYKSHGRDDWRFSPANRLRNDLPTILSSFNSSFAGVSARVQAGREAAFNAARLVLDEVDQRPDLLIGELSLPGRHLPAVAFLLDLSVRDGAEDVRVGTADAEEQPLASPPVGGRAGHLHHVLNLAPTAVALVAEGAPDVDGLDRRLFVPEAARRLLLRHLSVAIARAGLSDLQEAGPERPPEIPDVHLAHVGLLDLSRRRRI